MWLVSARRPPRSTAASSYGCQIVAAEHGDPAVARDDEVGVEAPAVGERRDLAGLRIDAREMRDAAVLDQREDAVAVG